MLESEDVCRGYFSLIHLVKLSRIRPPAAEEEVKTWEAGVGGSFHLLQSCVKARRWKGWST